MTKTSQSTKLKRDPSKLLFSVAGARGIVGESLDADVVTRLTLAFCAILPPGPVVVGRDTRPSGEALKYSTLGAVMATGRGCIDIDIATTPTVEMTVERLGAAGGIIVTASHNSVEWNALKFLDSRGIFISKEASAKLLERFKNNHFVLADGKSQGKLRTYDNASQDHIDAILSLDVIDVTKISKHKFTVVLDCINGAGSVIAPALLGALGVRVVELDCKTDGDFHRNPEPTPENLTVLAERVKRENADIGFAADPDADRLALVDHEGNAISEEYTLALAVEHVLSNQSGPVVVNLSTSSLVDRIAGEHGICVSRTPVGEAHVVGEMLESGAVVGGEGNGGVIYPKLHPGRDAVLAMALILQLLAENGTSLREQINNYPPIFMVKKKAKKQGDFSQEKISNLIRKLKPDTIDTRDGVKALFPDSWFHLRVSNTEGIVRIIAEATTRVGVQSMLKAARRVLEEASH